VSRGLAGRVGLVLLLWLLGGRVGLFVGLAIALVDLFSRPSPALLLRASLLGFCLLPLAVVIRGLPRPSTVTPLFAGSNLVAHYLAGTALALLVLGILRDVRPAPRPAGPGNGPPPNGYELPAPLPSPPVQERLPAPDDADAGGNGAREAQPALPSAIHPPLWDPARRRSADDTAPPPDQATPTHPPLWDPARRHHAGRAATADTTAAETAPPPEEARPTHPPLRNPARSSHPAKDRPGRKGRPHPPELRIAGGPPGTQADRAQQEPGPPGGKDQPVPKPADQPVPDPADELPGMRPERAGQPAQEGDDRPPEQEGDGGSAVPPSDRAEDSPTPEGEKDPTGE
jgi:hypothetical protein